MLELAFPHLTGKWAASIASAALIAAGVLGFAGCSSPSSSECTSDGEEALTKCATGTTTRGVDVSVYQGNVNWTQVKAAGRPYAFARVSDGLKYPDSKFAQNWPAMKKAGVVRSVYQFFRPSQDGGQQAQLLLDRVAAAGGIGPGDLPPVIDIETDDGQSPSVVVARATAWLAKVEAKIGRTAIVYTSARMNPVIGNAFKSRVLWVAHYGVSCPNLPSAWSNWQFWQNSDSGSVTGISGAVDTDLFNGTLTQLQSLLIKAPPVDAGAHPTDAGAHPADAGHPTDGGAHADGGDAGGAIAMPELPEHDGTIPGDSKPNDGSEGATLGSSEPPMGTAAAPLEPCAP